jgi:hypothetical protein
MQREPGIRDADRRPAVALATDVGGGKEPAEHLRARVPAGVAHQRVAGGHGEAEVVALL